MRHDWDASVFGSRPRDMLIHGRRRCRRCGLEQKKHDKQVWQRVVGYYWWPKSLKCQPVKWKREQAGNYRSEDGRFSLWREPYYPRHWYVNEVYADGEHSDALFASGHPTKAEATVALLEELAHWEAES